MKPILREKCPNTEFLLVRIFPHLDWIRRDTKYLSVFSLNAGKCGQEKTPYLDTFHVDEFSNRTKQQLYWQSFHADVINSRLVFSRFFIFAEISEMRKKQNINLTEVFHVKPPSRFLNFATRKLWNIHCKFF